MLSCRVLVNRSDFRLQVDFEVSPTEIVAVVGPNGAGKTTLLRVLAGLEPVELGHVTVDDEIWEDTERALSLAPEKRRVGYVPQEGLLFPHLNILDNVSFGLPAGQGDAAASWLSRLGLDDLADSKPDQLSGGQRQLVAFARAQVVRPSVLLLDEPLASVDVANRATVRRTLRRELRDSPGYRLVVTHDPLEAAALADRIVVLDRGAVTQIGSIDDLRTHPRSRYVAELVGMNFFSGDAGSGVITLGNGATIVTASAPDGPVLATVHPRAVSLYFERPSGSPRNVWLNRIAAIEPSLDRVRIHLAGPVDLVAEVTRAGAVDFREGNDVWVAVKATEVMAYAQ